MKKFIAAILAITLLVTSVDLQLLAAPAEEVATEETVDRNDEETEVDMELSENDPQILSEVKEEREESSKTFLMSDGTFMVAQYAAPIHYEDENRKWQEINHALVEETAGTASDAEDGYTTTEKAGDCDRIKFSKKLKEGKTVTIKNTEFPLSWGVKDAEKQTVQVISSENEEPKKWNDKFLFVDTGSQVLRYADIFEGVDAEYMIQSGGIKENIILKEKGTKTSFEIVYDIGKLTPVQVDKHNVQLKDGD